MMGNTGTCCAGNNQQPAGNIDNGCCRTPCKRPGGENVAPLGGPASAKSLPSGEVIGIDCAPPPGIDSLVHLGPDGQGGDKDSNGSKEAGASNTNGHSVTYKDGTTYVGQLVGGKRHGRGIRKSPAGAYDGEWEADLPHGHGRQTWADGRCYEGQFENGKYSGHGHMVWSTQKGQLVYDGEYRDDLKHGHGKFMWADGRTYEGEWCCGKRHGRGSYVNARLEQKVGYWIDDKFDRWEADDAT